MNGRIEASFFGLLTICITIVIGICIFEIEIPVLIEVCGIGFELIRDAIVVIVEDGASCVASIGNYSRLVLVPVRICSADIFSGAGIGICVKISGRIPYRFAVPCVTDGIVCHGIGRGAQTVYLIERLRFKLRIVHYYVAILRGESRFVVSVKRIGPVADFFTV